MTKQKFLKLEDVTLYYEILKRDPTLVYLHGTTTNHTIFNHQREHFHKKGTGSLALDQRGDGKSTHLSDESSYALDTYTSDLERVLGHEGVTNMSIVGHSMGTLVAQNYAVKHSENVDALVLISASYDFKKSFGRDLFKRLGLKLIPLMRNLLTGYNIIKGISSHDRVSYYSDFSEDRFKHMSDLAFTLELYGKNSLEYVKAMHALSNAMIEFNTELIAPLIQAPTLLIHGDSDQAVSLATAFELKEMIPNSIVEIIPNSKHGVVFQSPELITQAMEKFLLGEIYSEKLR